MTQHIYNDLTPWYLLLDPTEDHADDAAFFAAALRTAATGEVRTLLELGAGAGNSAHFLRHEFACTLTDLSPEMLALSAARHPDCRHLLGDMTTLRLHERFDAVLVHDAASYLTTRGELEALAATIAAHLRPGGAALVAPDCVTESFREWSDLHEANDGDRAMRCLEWFWRPDPDASVAMAEYVFTLREPGPDGAPTVRVIHDRHRCGLHPIAAWRSAFEAAGLQAEAIVRDLGDEPNSPYWDHVWLLRRGL